MTKVSPKMERILKNAMPDFMLIGSNAFDHKKVHRFLDRGGYVMWALAAVVQKADEDEVSFNDAYSIGCAENITCYCHHGFDVCMYITVDIIDTYINTVTNTNLKTP